MLALPASGETNASALGDPTIGAAATVGTPGSGFGVSSSGGSSSVTGSPIVGSPGIPGGLLGSTPVTPAQAGQVLEQLLGPAGTLQSPGTPYPGSSRVATDPSLAVAVTTPSGASAATGSASSPALSVVQLPALGPGDPTVSVPPGIGGVPQAFPTIPASLLTPPTDIAGGTAGAITPPSSIATPGQNAAGSGGGGPPADSVTTIGTLRAPVGGPATLLIGTPNLNLPTSGLYTTHPAPGQPYLITTDGPFAETAVSSLQLITAAGGNPADAGKLLGDGFYESQLVSQQVTALTGAALLPGTDSSLAQYQALLDNGAQYAKEFGLTPGVALTAQQMGQLTSDMVWLVSEQVDGQTVLVPQVYLTQAVANDLSSNGSLISANAIDLQTSNLENFGTIASSRGTQITSSGAITNTGTVSAGGNLTLVAGGDLSNIAGTISAGGNIGLEAGGDVTLGATTTTQPRVAVGFTDYTPTTITGVSTVAAGGDLTVIAGDTASLIVAQVSAGNNLTISGNNVTIGALTDSTYEASGSGKNQSAEYDETVVGSNLSAGAALQIGATNTIAITASNVAATGALTVAAGGNLTVTGQTQTSATYAQTSTSTSGFLSTTQTNTTSASTVQTVVGSVLSGGSVGLSSGGDTSIIASSVVGNDDVSIAALGNLTVGAAQETSTYSSSASTTSSGLSFAPSGLGVQFGVSNVSQTANGSSVTQVGSTIGSLSGDVTLNANGATTVTAATIAAAGDLAIGGASVTVNAADNTTTDTQTSHVSFAGLTASLTIPGLTAATTALGDVQQAGAVTNTNLAALLTIEAGTQAQQLVSDLKNPLKGGVASVSLGSNSSTSTSTNNSTTAVTSALSGTNVTIDARSGDVSLVGATVSATNAVAITAAQNIDLTAAQNTTTGSSSTSNFGVAIGAQMGFGSGAAGLSVSGDVKTGQGSTASSSVSNVGTLINAGGTVSLTSGGDTNIVGSQVSGTTIDAAIAGNLNIVSLQNTNTYTSQSTSADLGVVATGSIVGGSVAITDNTLNSSWKSVVDQAGLYAGSGGFDVNVAGNTNLVGAVIASTANPAQNSLTTGTLTTSNLTNDATYAGQNASLGAGYKPGTGYNGFTAQPPSTVDAHGASTSTTESGISAGSVSITNAPAQAALTGETVAQTLAAINTNTGAGPNTLAQTNIDAIQEDMHAAGLFGTEANQLISYEQQQAANLKKAALISGTDTPEGASDAVSAANLSNQWGFGGTDRNIINALVGAVTGDATGSLGSIAQATVGNFAGSEISGVIGKAAGSPGSNVPDGSLLNVILHSAGACLAALVGNENCGSSSFGAGVAAAATNIFGGVKSGETVDQQQNIANLIETISSAGGLAIGTGNDADVTSAATSATENNYLGKSQMKQEDNEVEACNNNLPCILSVWQKYGDISNAQNGALLDGFVSGFGNSLSQTIQALIGLLNVPQTIQTINQALNDPNLVSQIGSALVAKYQNDLAAWNNAGSNGGIQASEALGEDIGEIVAQLALIPVGGTIGKAASSAIQLAKGIVAGAAAADLSGVATSSGGTILKVIGSETTVYTRPVALGPPAISPPVLPAAPKMLALPAPARQLALPGGSSALTKLTPAQQLVLNNRGGNAFEAAVRNFFGLPKNTKVFTVTLQDGSVIKFIPDLDAGTSLIEVKNVVNLTMSSQLRGYFASGNVVNLVVSPSTKTISQSVIDAVKESGGTINIYNPATGILTPWP